MTIAISLKVNDGVVLAADSAATLMGITPQGPAVVQVFNNANKVFNLRKGLPIGLITWGQGGIGQAGISTLYKDLRVRITEPDPAFPGWHVDPASYTIQHVAELAKKFIYDEHYVPAFKSWTGEKPVLGFIVAGYSSSGSALAEEYIVSIDAKGLATGPTLVRPISEMGATAQGDPEAIYRLLLGFSPKLGSILQNDLGADPKTIPGALQVIKTKLQAQLIYDAMPIQDAIDVAEFLVDVTERFSRYTPGAATVGGPIEIAAITKHEGFKWVKRKYYFTEAWNPTREHK